MPTGYTAGIMDGSLKDFESYAKLCLRNFGATIHMRDEPLSKQWEERTPSEYHQQRIKECEETIEAIKNMSDDELVKQEVAELKKNKKYHQEAIKEGSQQKARLESFLSRAKEWEAPSDEHVNFKNFLESQITETIKFEFSSNYHEAQIEKIDKQLSHMHPDELRAQKIAQYSKNLSYHREQYAEDVTRCSRANEWVRQVLETFSTNQEAV